MIDLATAVIPDDAVVYSLLKSSTGSLVDGAEPDVVASHTGLSIKHKFCGTVKMNVTIAVRGQLGFGQRFVRMYDI